MKRTKEGHLQQVLGTSDLVLDAWGRQKTITDFSMFHGMFTFEVPERMWIETSDLVEQPFAQFTSFNGMLKCQGLAGVEARLTSKRHPRYQPNRGLLYSSSMILPDVATTAIHDFGMFNHQSGVFFRTASNVLYAVKRTMVNGVVSEIVEEITLPDTIDLSKGNIFDIQMQWRGVGNMFFYVNQELVHKFKLLGTLDVISTFNPAMPIGFQITGDAVMYCGCADVTSEGGSEENRQRGTADSEEIALSTAEIPIILLHFKNTFDYNGVQVINTRDSVLRRITGYADVDTIIRIYFSRDASKFTGTTYADNDSIGSVEVAFDGDIVLDNLTTNITRSLTRRIEALTSVSIENPDSDVGDLFLTHGDHILVTMQAKNNTFGGATIEYGIEI
ncbi:MAG: hypothetical protein GQ570_08620 [Helicobacteraceae bacterium]|nr:hypothetical protein [Helicobacteraceae bacterium]